MSDGGDIVQHVSSIEEALKQIAGPDMNVASRTSVAGGCISNGECLTLSSGQRVFAKRSSRLPAAMFPAEALGLSALMCEGGPRVPRPLAVWPGIDHDGAEAGTGPSASRGSAERVQESFILMEWIETGRPARGFQATFGRALAHLHRTLTNDRYGFRSDNFIGSTPQKNGWSDSWIEFFTEQRIGYQVELARQRNLIDPDLVRSIDRILSRLDRILPEPDSASLLHGDLWGGNYICDDGGQPVLIDPAVYFGHPEADLAMTELFGGFRPEFYRAYREVSPLPPGYEDRRDLYNLYHMLNHLNIFGTSYLGSVRSIVTRYA